MSRTPNASPGVANAFNGDDDDDIPTLAAPALVAASAPVSQVSVGAKDVVNEARVWIILEENEGIPPTGQYIAVNGRNWHLKPGVPAYVPAAIINVLNDAIMSVPIKDADGNRIVDYRDKLRCPYRLVNAPRNAQAA